MNRPVALGTMILLALLFGACSSGASAAVRGRRVCAAYETFWDTDYSGGAPPANLLAAQRKVLAAVDADRHKKLDDAVRAVVAGELSLPLDGKHYAKQLASLPKSTKDRLAGVNLAAPIVESQCDALGRHING